MPELGNPREIFEKAQYLVEIQGIDQARFVTCSELRVEVEKIAYREGGSILPFQMPGRATVSDITLEIGLGRDRSFYDWIVQVIDMLGGRGMAGGSGDVDPAFRRDLSIRVLRRDIAPAVRFKVYSTWPSSLQAGGWDANASEVLMEQLVLVPQRWERAQSAD